MKCKSWNRNIYARGELVERHYQGALRELSDCPIRSAARVWVTTVSGTVTPNCMLRLYP